MATKKTEENVDLKAAKEQLEALKEEMLKAAREEAAAIIAKAQAEAKEPAAAPAVNKKEMERLEERVTVTLFKDNGKYKEPVFLSINGDNCVIQRGVPVSIKKKFALLLQEQQRQAKAAADNDEYWQSQFAKAAQDKIL